ncbi:AAA family ATPase [Bermanella sp. WJH001]|uniref:AAA family ATPase n=1 Tax=Bermanella sp. WJH001 TaxID=3048005 RepID=UPI0024BE3003|nr:MoxR family ATPase [Bermanella sp. WJH001]MDJ1536917.1 MoxR family ATPase [Bermanella sp. WJH001]
MDAKLSSVLSALNSVVLGKEHQVKLALSCLLAKGHLLIEDLPGMGKTTLSHALANVLGLQYQRIQFTSDMLPADIVGGSIYQKDEQTQQGAFVFHPGPVFSQVVLADEINRATPKTQSALLEAMEERQVSIDGKTHALPQPFFVIATQNPISQSGTFTLPESQLDRFLMRIELGYPNAKAERALLEGRSNSSISLPTLMNEKELSMYQSKVASVAASSALLDYIQRLIAQTREHALLRYGLSPRAAIALLNTSKSWALLHGRDHVLPDDVQDVFRYVAQHRLEDALVDSKKDICADILQAVSVL